MYFLPYSQNIFSEKQTRTDFDSLVYYFIIQLHRKQLCFFVSASPTCAITHPGNSRIHPWETERVENQSLVAFIVEIVLDFAEPLGSLEHTDVLDSLDLTPVLEKHWTVPVWTYETSLVQIWNG